MKVHDDTGYKKKIPIIVLAMLIRCGIIELYQLKIVSYHDILEKSVFLKGTLLYLHYEGRPSTHHKLWITPKMIGFHKSTWIFTKLFMTVFS